MNVFQSAWAKWKKIARVIGNFQARVILSVLYVVMIVPVGLVVRAVSDPLKTKKKADSYWIAREESAPSLEDARGQF